MKSRVNYLYFGAFFAFLVLLCASSVFTKENLGGAPLFFFLYGLGQVILEIVFLIFLFVVLGKYLGKFAAALFIGLTFVGLVFHFFDFLMDRVVDLSVWEALNIFVFQENLENFLFLLDASGIPLWIWALFFLSFAALPLLGIFIYHLTDKVASKRPVFISQSHFLQAFLCIPVALLLWDVSASKVIHPDAYTAFRKSIPWKCTFLQPQSSHFALSSPLKPPVKEKQAEEWIASNTSIPTKRPNIYIFIAESLRADAITLEIAPHLTQFKNDFVSFNQAISGGNATIISWFSIFYSQYPFLWKHFQEDWKTGSPALKLLKKWGYQVHLYTSAQLGFYGMKTLLFGQNANLLNTEQTFHHAPPESAADSDKAALLKLQKDLKEHPEWQEGQIFIVFWDCTHFDYSIPKNWTPKFTPFAREFAFFKAFHSEKTIRMIKNRYHNSVNYLDHLFGIFQETMPNDAIVVFTGDHGEEFFDHGHLFHTSHLSQEQISVPLYFKFGDGSKKIQNRPLISQMDIFPSIIDYLGAPVPDFLEGNSLFQKAKFPYSVTARFNAGRTPYEFSLQNGRSKLIAQFANRKNIFASKELKIISLRNPSDQSVDPEDVDDWIGAEFGPAIHWLFNYPLEAD